MYSCFNLEFWKDRDGHWRARLSMLDPHSELVPCQVAKHVTFCTGPHDSSANAFYEAMALRLEAFRCKTCGGVPIVHLGLVEVADKVTGEPICAEPCSECPIKRNNGQK